MGFLRVLEGRKEEDQGQYKAGIAVPRSGTNRTEAKND